MTPSLITANWALVNPFLTSLFIKVSIKSKVFWFIPTTSALPSSTTGYGIFIFILPVSGTKFVTCIVFLSFTVKDDISTSYVVPLLLQAALTSTSLPLTNTLTLSKPSVHVIYNFPWPLYPLKVYMLLTIKVSST